MARRIGDLLAQQATEGFVGRGAELRTLLQGVDTGPPVVFVHGIGGMGKSSLLAAFAAQARSRGITVVRLDCGAIEPTERGFLQELATAIGGQSAALDETVQRLSHLSGRVVLALDTYEVFRLLDTWLRQVFIPALNDNVQVLLFGREPPVAAWYTSPGWQDLFRSIDLGPLEDGEALALLARAGIGPEQARRINRVARGHPLALTLGASAVRGRSDLELEQTAIQRVVDELTHLFLTDVQDPLTRQALEAASVARCTTLSLLRAMLPQVAPQDAFDRLHTLPFVERGPDGLHIHDAVQQAIATELRARDPIRCRDYRRAIWRQLRAEVRTAPLSELWRYTADMLYILENPVVREAFFPSSAPVYAMEPARPEDGQDIQAITQLHEGPDAAATLLQWWTHLPGSFSVARDQDGLVAGFYCMFDPAPVSPALLQNDPIVRIWWDHLRANPVPKDQRVLFCRRWLGREHGEAPSAFQAASWLDIKRTYMELRPHLRRCYITVRDLATYAPAAVRLGFRPFQEATQDGSTYHSAVLDFGPSSVDGWLANLVGAELDVEEERLLDTDARELALDDRRVPLTRLEFGVMEYLYRHEGKAVSRQSLLADVWGYDYEGGSNVVDAVVRSLRKKLGPQASLIETVTGIGYRLRSG